MPQMIAGDVQPRSIDEIESLASLNVSMRTVLYHIGNCQNSEQFMVAYAELGRRGICLVGEGSSIGGISCEVEEGCEKQAISILEGLSLPGVELFDEPRKLILPREEENNRLIERCKQMETQIEGQFLDQVGRDEAN